MRTVSKSRMDVYPPNVLFGFFIFAVFQIRMWAEALECDRLVKEPQTFRYIFIFLFHFAIFSFLIFILFPFFLHFASCDFVHGLCKAKLHTFVIAIP